MQELWLEALTAGRGSKPPRHPLASLVDAWKRLAPVPAEWDAREHPVMPGTLGWPRRWLTPAGGDERPAPAA